MLSVVCSPFPMEQSIVLNSLPWSGKEPSGTTSEGSCRITYPYSVDSARTEDYHSCQVLQVTPVGDRMCSSYAWGVRAENRI